MVNGLQRNASSFIALTLAVSSILGITSPSFAIDQAAGDAPNTSGTTVVPLIQQNFSDLAGKQGLMITVEYAPGASTPVHKHDAHVFVYV